jgi:hypothetical protein
MLYQSFSQVFVTNTATLLASGSTVDYLGVGQIGILDAKTYKAVSAPTYATNKALFAVWGTPDLFVGEFSGVPNENEYSKIIKGKLIKRFRAKRAKRGVSPIWTVGFSGGENDTDTLSVRAGESKDLFIKLTGTVIDRLYSTQGLTKQFRTTPSTLDDCDDACATVGAGAIARELVESINSDKDLRKFIRAGVIRSVAEDVTTASCYKYNVPVCDTGDDIALGQIQAAYSTLKINRESRSGATSVYTAFKTSHSTPSAYTQPGVYLTDCASCPSGYTLTATAKVFQVRTPNGTSAGTVNGIFTGEVTTTAVSVGPQFNIYYVTFATTVDTDTTIAAGVAAGYDVTLVGIQSGICTLDSPTSSTWVEDTSKTYESRTKTYTITLKDNVCGTSRLADLQAAYPLLTVALVSSDVGACVHTFSTSTSSDCYEVGCSIGSIVYNPPAVFEGQAWVAAADDDGDADTLFGIEITSAFFNVNTNECTFNAFPYENDVVHVQVSNHDPNFNGDPNADEWVVKKIREVQFPQGHGAYVRKLEQESKGYDRRDRSWDPVVREVQGYSFQADPNKFYDQYVLEYDTKWKSAGGWGQDYTQSISLNFFVPEGQGGNLETVFNTYLTSAGIEEDGASV